MRPAVSFRDVSFRYPDGDRWALRDVTLDIESGSFALIAGHTASGKSTLLRAMNGLVPHFTGGTFSGAVRIDERNTLDHPPRALADAVGFVPQDPGGSFVLDRVEEELAYAMENLAVAPATMRRRVEEVLDLLRIDDLRARSVRTLSGGERQRVAIAAALTAAPRILVLDEPTSQLDPQGAEDVLAALQRLVHDGGLTVVIAEHRLERVAGFVDVAFGCTGDGGVIGGSPHDVLDALDIGPPVTRLGRVLGWSPAPLTVRDARRHAATITLDEAPAPNDSLPGRELVKVERATARYGDVVALAEVELSARANAVLVLVGRNGAGKTTLLRCLAGLHQPSVGRVVVEGQRPVPGRHVALCPQDPDALLFRDRVIDEIDATVRALKRDTSARSILVDAGIDHLSERHPRDLSAGERLLVAVAAIAATGAAVLALDEPTRGLDARSKRRLVGLLKGYARAGNAVVVATHDVELAAELADRVVMLAGGEVIAEGTPSAVIGDSPVFAPQTARVFGPTWLTPEAVATAMVGG